MLSKQLFLSNENNRKKKNIKFKIIFVRETKLKPFVEQK